MSTAYTTQEAARTIVTKEIRALNLAAGATTEVDLLDIPAGASVGLIKAKLVEEFGGATATITNLSIKVGDDDDDDGFIEAKSVLTGDTPIAHSQSDGAYISTAVVISDAADTTVRIPGTLKLYSAAKTLKVLFTKTGSGNATALFTKGRLRFSIEIIS